MQYVADAAPRVKGLQYGAAVLGTKHGLTLTVLDASAALGMPGVTAFVSAADLPGLGIKYRFSSSLTGLPPSQLANYFAHKEAVV